MQITPTGVTRLINPLQEAGYVEPLQSPNDRRVVRFGLTRRGTKLADDMMSEVEDQLLGLVKHLGKEDSRALILLMSSSIEFFASQFEN